MGDIFFFLQRKTSKKKINTIYCLLRNFILQNKLHLHLPWRSSCAQEGLFFSKMPFFFAKRKDFRIKRKYTKYTVQSDSQVNAKSPSIGDVIWSATNRLEKYLQNRLKLEKERTRL